MSYQPPFKFMHPVSGTAPCEKNQEVAALLSLYLRDHHFIVQRSLSRGQLHSIRQEAGCLIKDMGVY